MPKVLRIDSSVEEGVKQLIRFLLEKGKVKGILTLRRIDENGAVAYSLVTNPDAFDEALPLFPLMPANSAKSLSRLTLIEPADKPVAAVLRPCELRALVELVKRNQGSLENILIISLTCGGVYPLEMAVNGDIGEKLPQYWEAVKQGEIIPDLRPSCKACEHFLPYTADISISLLGDKDIDKRCAMFLNTDKGESSVEGISGQFAEEELDSEAMQQIRNKRTAEKEKLFDTAEMKSIATDGLANVFSRCIGCHNCSKVCPICYCRLCFFDSGAEEHEPFYYETQLEKMGYAQVLPDTLLYHLVRLFHVSISCVGCGLCADVCPANIPLWAISLKTGGAV